MSSEEANERSFFQRRSDKQYKKQTEFISNSFNNAAFRYTDELSSRVHCSKVY